MPVKNTQELRQLLLDTIEGVKSGEIDPKKAHAIASLSSKILQSARIDLEVLKYNSEDGRTMKAGETVLQLINEK